MRNAVKLLLGMAIITGCGITSFANGYKILNVKSGKATAMGEAFIVQADDPSAIAFNPAGLAQLKGNQVNVHATVCNAYITHHSPAGVSTDNEDKWQTIPSVFVTTDMMGFENVTAGIGISLPNGISSEWAEDSFARYVATYSELTVADINPALGMKVSDNVMIGAGVNYYYSTAQLESMADAGTLAGGLPIGIDVPGKLEGDGTAWGGNVGLIYKINEKHSAAVTYHHAYSIDYDGDMTVGGIPTDIEASLDFPAVVVAGYALRPTDKWTVEFNADWTDWKSVDDIEIRSDIPGLINIDQKQDLRDTIAYKFGAQYQYTDNLALRCGYIYNEKATPERNWRPSLPDTDVHFFTAGFGYDIGNLTIDTALQFVHYEKRTIDNNVDWNELTSLSSVDGTYRTWAPCASVAATYRF
ncbi:OmpP1/FadL family transporter [Verrucomicrobiota bacterium]